MLLSFSTTRIETVILTSRLSVISERLGFRDTLYFSIHPSSMTRSSSCSGTPKWPIWPFRRIASSRQRSTNDRNRRENNHSMLYSPKCLYTSLPDPCCAIVTALTGSGLRLWSGATLFPSGRRSPPHLPWTYPCKDSVRSSRWALGSFSNAVSQLRQSPES